MTRHVPVKGLKIVTAMLNMYHEANLPRHNHLTPPTKSEMQLIKILLKISDSRGRPACVATLWGRSDDNELAKLRRQSSWVHFAKMHFG